MACGLCYDCTIQLDLPAATGCESG